MVTRISIILTTVFIFVSINADDICGIPKIKPIFNYTLNNGELGNILDGDEAVVHSFPWMIRLLH